MSFRASLARASAGQVPTRQQTAMDFHNFLWALTPLVVGRSGQDTAADDRHLVRLAPEPGRTPGRPCEAKAQSFRPSSGSNRRSRCAERVVRRKARLQWHRNEGCWAAQLLKWGAHNWLQQRKAGPKSASMYSGSVGTRIAAGKVRMRWHDGVETGRAACANAQAQSASVARARTSEAIRCRALGLRQACALFI